MTESRRLDNLRGKLKELLLDGLIVLDIRNVRYLTGFTGSTAGLVITKDRQVLFVDGRYKTQAEEESSYFEIIHYKFQQVKAIVDFALSLPSCRIGFECDSTTYRQYLQLKQLRAKGFSLTAVKNIVSELRLVKDSSEIEAIRQAVEIADRCFAEIIEIIRPGLAEREIALEIDYRMRKLGASKNAFETIVASGPRSALPHASPSDRKLQNGDFVIMDFGAVYADYSSDITRTVHIGKADEKAKEIYNLVLEAQKRALNAVRPGVSGKYVDSAARDCIVEAGYGEKFGHGTGHSLGLDVHDGAAFSQQSEIILKPGIVATVEPGIYIERYGGVRIEDDIVVNETGCEILTKSSKQLVEI